MRRALAAPAFALALAVAFAFIGALAACRRAGDPVRAPIEGIAAAAEKRDADAVAAWLSADYRDDYGNGKTEVANEVRRYLFGYDRVGVRLSDVVVEPSGDSAIVSFRADLSGTPKQIGGLAGMLPSSGAYRFRVRVVKEGDAWRIAWAAWQEAG